MATTKKSKTRTRKTPAKAVFFRHPSGALTLSLLGIQADRLERIAVSFEVSNPDSIHRELLEVADKVRYLSRHYMGGAGYVETDSMEQQGPRHRIVRHPHTGKTLRVIDGGAQGNAGFKDG
jgi:hypothetical protein